MQTQQIGKLKNDLFTKGYTYFNINDFTEFEGQYEYYKKYICNETSNIKKHIECVRADGGFTSIIAQNGLEKFHLHDRYGSFEAANKFAIDFFQKNKVESSQISQYWYYGEERGVMEDFYNIFDKISNYFYNETGEYRIGYHSQFTYYKKGCFLQKHQDGLTGNRICAILFYLNEDYKQEYGGNLILDDKDLILPIYGNVAIIDFTSGNVSHEVTKVLDGIGRYAVLAFAETQNKKYVSNVI
jgi:hypothetical protein